MPPTPSVFGRPKPQPVPKKSNAPLRKWVPRPKKAITDADFMATNNALRASGDKIANMERKIERIASEMRAPHPLMELLDRKSTPVSGKSGKSKSSSIAANGDHSTDMYWDDPPEYITLKSHTMYTDDIHKAREVQKLIENRRRFFDGELNTTFDKVGSQTMQGKLSSDDEDTPSVTDSAEATYGSSIDSGRDDRLEEVIPLPVTSSRNTYSECRSSGYSEDDELSVAESCEDLTGKLTLFQQKTQRYNRRNMESERKHSSMYKQMLRDPNVSHENFIMAKRYFLPDELLHLPKVNYRPGQRGQKKLTKVNPYSAERKPKTPVSAGKNTQRRMGTANSQNQGKKLIRPILKRGWTAYKRAKAMGILLYDYRDSEDDKESSSDELPRTPNLSLLQSTGPAITDPRFSMTKVIETTRLAEREADLQMGIIGLGKYSTKKVKKRYGPIAAIASRVSGKVESERSMSSQPSTPTSASARSSITASTPMGKIIRKIVVKDEKEKPKLTRKIIVKDEEKKPRPTRKIVVKDEEKKPKTTRKIVVKDEKKLNSKSPVDPKMAVEEKSEDPTPIPLEEIGTTNEYGALKLDSNSNLSMPCIMLPPLNRFQPSQITSLASLSSTKTLNSWVPKNYSEDKRVSSKLLLKSRGQASFQSLRGQSRINTGKEKGFVPMKDEEKVESKETTDGRTKVVEPVMRYTKLQRKQEIVRPGDPDVTNDPRFLSLLEVLVPVYQPRIKTWKNMPATAIPPATPQESKTSIERPPSPDKTAVQKKRKSYPPIPRSHIPLSPPQ